MAKEVLKIALAVIIANMAMNAARKYIPGASSIL